MSHLVLLNDPEIKGEKEDKKKKYSINTQSVSMDRSKTFPKRLKRFNKIIIPKKSPSKVFSYLRTLGFNSFGDRSESITRR